MLFYFSTPVSNCETKKNQRKIKGILQNLILTDSKTRFILFVTSIKMFQTAQRTKF